MSAIHALLTHLDRLRAQHRAGVVPAFGELDELWDFAADVRGELATGQLTSAPTPIVAGIQPTARLFIEMVDAAGQVLHRVPVQGAAQKGSAS